MFVNVFIKLMYTPELNLNFKAGQTTMMLLIPLLYLSRNGFVL